MEKPNGGHRWRTLRPLFWWFLIVLVLYGIRTHQRLSALTNVQFAASVAGKSNSPEPSAQLDGQPFFSGQRVALGSHQLVVTHPQGKSLTTNFFVWYGTHDLGALALERTTGTLTVTATPPAQAVTISGPEWQKELSKVSSENVTVPTDEYTVTAAYPFFTETNTVVVTNGQTAICSFAPAVGALQINYDHAGATFELHRLETPQFVDHGDLPLTSTELPAGHYELRVIYQSVEKDQTLEIVAAQTNLVSIEFSLGSVSFATTPPGAMVRDERGKELGVTPLTLADIPVGTWLGEIVLPEYQPVTVTVPVLEKQTVIFQTNLVRRAFAAAMAVAAQVQNDSSGNFAPLIDALTAAVADDPANMTAAAMLKNVRVSQALADANGKVRNGDFAGALRDGEAAMAILPESSEAQRMVDYCSKSIQEKVAKADAEKQQQEAALRLSRPKDYFAKLMSETPNSGDFSEQVMNVRGQVADIRAKLADALSNTILLKFTIETNDEPFEGGFMIRCKQSQMDGFRRCYLVGGQTADGQVTICYKVFEYVWPPDAALSGVFGKVSEDRAIPLTQSSVSPELIESHRALGIKMIAERIQNAAGR